jgi:serine/threonine protein kinase
VSEVDKRRFGKYWILAHLATGGMAEIQLATHSSLGGFRKLVVLKRILPNLAQEERFVRQFLDEARIAAKLHHPNVVDIFDLGLPSWPPASSCRPPRVCTMRTPCAMRTTNRCASCTAT